MLFYLHQTLEKFIKWFLSLSFVGAFILTAPVLASDDQNLEQAYLKEISYLKEQKKIFAEKLAQIKQTKEKALKEKQDELVAAQDRHTNLANEINQLTESLLTYEENTEQAGGTSGDLLVQAGGTIEQAIASTKKYASIYNVTSKLTLPHTGQIATNSNIPGNNGKREGQAEADDAGNLGSLRKHLALINEDLNSIFPRTYQHYVIDREYYSVSGIKITGPVFFVGSVMALSLAPGQEGSLIPLEDGSLKVANLSPEKSLQELRKSSPGQIDELFNSYLYEPLAKNSEPPPEKTFSEIIATGGVIGYLTILLGIIALGLIIVRFLNLKILEAWTPDMQISTDSKIRRKDLDGAITILQKSRGATARAILHTLNGYKQNPDNLDDFIAQGILEQTTRIDKFSSVITVVATVAPLLGLLGTVTGMITTFDIITKFGNSDPKLLSSGIAEALTTTMIGLCVAIPVLFFGNLLSGWADDIKVSVEKAIYHVCSTWESKLTD